MKRLVSACALAFILAACGDNNVGAGLDARIDSMPADMGTIDTPEIDAPMIDAMPTAAEAINAVKAATDEVAISLPVFDATVTYLKPFIAGATPGNDPAGFFVQVGATGPALFVAVDPATLTTLTPALAVGDVVSFTVTEKDTSGSSPRATMIDAISRSATGTDVAPFVQDITAVTGIVGMITDFDSELVDVTAATIVEAFGASGNAYSRARITTTGVPTLDNNFQLRLPTTFKDTLDLEVGCVVAVHRTPVNRFGSQFQVSAFNTTDLTITSCPAPTVSSATATAATTVTVTFSRNIDMATLLANGSQFTIVDDATVPNALAVTAAALTGPRTVTLTTAAQTSGANYTVTVANTVEDTVGTALAAPLTANFTGFSIPIPTVMMAAATDATTVNVTFTRPILATSVMTDGSQFTIVDNATPTPNTLVVSAASVTGMVVTLTTAAQTPGTMYTVTVANTVTDTDGTAVGAPLSASFLGFTPVVAANHLVINEIDYDNNGTDNAEFIEILNPTNAAISLVGKRVVLVNGDASAAPVLYSGGAGIFDLSSLGMLDAGQYLVLGPATLVSGLPSTVKTLAFPAATDQVQNGARDSAYLIDVGNAGMSIAPTIIDSITYEGNTSANLTYDADGQSLVLAPEGTSSTAADVNNANGSVCRSPNGADSDNNSTDIKFCSMQTAGAPNTL